MLPSAADCSAIRTNSSPPIASVCVFAASTPNSRRIRADDALSTHRAGRVTAWKIRSGHATAIDTPTGRAIAKLFGVTSPSTMWRKLINEKPTTKLTR